MVWACCLLQLSRDKDYKKFLRYQILFHEESANALIKTIQTARLVTNVRNNFTNNQFHLLFEKMWHLGI